MSAKRTQTRLLLGFLVVAVAGATIAAQDQPALSFEAASIRPADPAARGMSMDMSPAGHITFRGTSMRGLLVWAYSGLREVEGAPGWFATDRYDVNLTAGRAITQDERTAMLRSLLTERLKLKFRIETREQPAFALTLLRSDGQVGPDITRSTLDCAAIARAGREGGAPPPLAPNGSPPCGFTQSDGVMKRSGASMASIASSLRTAAGREVVDRTGMTGLFDYTLRYSPNPDQPIQDYPGVFTAVQEQLGLKLEPTTAPVQIMVIESVERPSEN